MKVDVQGGSTKSGANVQQYKSNNTDSQKWKLVKVDTLQIQGKLYTPWGRQMPCEKATLYSSDGRKLGTFTGNDYDFKLNATMRSTDIPSHIVIETTCAGTPMKGTYQLKYGQIRELCNSKKLYISCLSVNSY